MTIANPQTAAAELERPREEEYDLDLMANYRSDQAVEYSDAARLRQHAFRHRVQVRRMRVSSVLRTRTPAKSTDAGTLMSDVWALEHSATPQNRPFALAAFVSALAIAATALLAPLAPGIAAVSFFIFWGAAFYVGYRMNAMNELHYGRPLVNPRYLVAAFAATVAFSAEALVLALSR